jgi:hypothetical protein
VACGDELRRSEQAASSSLSKISMNEVLSRRLTLLHVDVVGGVAGLPYAVDDS